MRSPTDSFLRGFASVCRASMSGINAMSVKQCDVRGRARAGGGGEVHGRRTLCRYYVCIHGTDPATYHNWTHGILYCFPRMWNSPKYSPNENTSAVCLVSLRAHVGGKRNWRQTTDMQYIKQLPRTDASSPLQAVLVTQKF